MSVVIRLGEIADERLLPKEPPITAVAIARGLPLYTFNPADFEGIEGLTVVAL